MINSQKLGLTLGTLIALGVAGGNAAHAQTTIVDSYQLNNAVAYTGPGVLGLGSGNTPFRGGLTYNGGANIYYHDGAISTILFNGSVGYGFNSAGTPDPASSPSTLLNQQVFTYDSGGVPTATFNLIYLTPGQSYNVVLYGAAGGGGANQGTKFTVTQAAGTLPAAQSTSDSQVNTFATPDNYVEFTGLVAKVDNFSGFAGGTAGVNNGGLQFSYTGTGNFGHFNGLQIEVTPPVSASPEPSQLAGIAFTALGALGLVLKARKRSLGGVA